MGRLLVIPLVLLALLAAAMVWSGGGPGQKADLIFINRGDIRTLDPNSMSWAEDIRVGYALFEGLYGLHPQTLEPGPGAAERIDVSENGTVYTFHLRTDGRWSNGDPVVVDDFLFAWRRMLEQAGEYSYLFFYIKGAEEYFEACKDNKPADFSTVEMRKLDDHTLRVTLKHAVPYFPDVVAFPPYFPLNRKSMQRFERPVPGKPERLPTYDPAFIRPPHFVTNGPYRLKAWEFKKRVLMEASEHYWDRKNVKSRVIEQVVMENNPLGEFLRYETGAVDLLLEAPAEQVGAFLEQARHDPAKKRKDLHVFPAFGTYFYSINCQEKLSDGRANPFSKVDVRRALAKTVPRQTIVDTVTRSGEVPAVHYVPLNTFKGYPVPKGQDYDLDGARKLLADAGYPGGSGFPQLKLTYNTGSVHGDVAQVMARHWRETLGISLELEPLETNAFKPRLNQKEYAIARASWYGDYPDVSTFTDKYLANSNNNDSGWVNKEYDALLARAGHEPDPLKRLELLSKAEGILLDEAPIICIYNYVNKYMFRPNVKGVSLNARNMVMFKSVYVER